LGLNLSVEIGNDSIESMEGGTTLYFGYGSNLDMSDWKDWCERKNEPHQGLVEIGPCWLPDYTMRFHYFSRGREGGAADIVENGRGHAVPGVLFGMDAATLAAMDRKEGVGAGIYERRNVRVALPDGTFREAITYCVTLKHIQERFVQPTQHYVGLIQNGLLKRELPIGELKNAIEEFSPSFPLDKLFVYGTLMQGEIRHQTTQQLCNGDGQSARAQGRLLNLGEFPGMVYGEHTIHGEVYNIDQVYAALQTLDSIEGFYGYDSNHSLYTRTIIKIETEQGMEWAWTYIYNSEDENVQQIVSGDWRNR
tara:strand:- start:2570 stop:3493 length:924 start_codon:yes stop_codon:yes gene_type:complete